jgi:hypothetical protein
MKKILNKIKTIDLFGKPISLNYKGQDTYQTKLGAFFSLVFMILMAVIGIGRFDKLIKLKNPNIIQYAKWIEHSDE